MADDWIRTGDLWNQKRQLYQLSQWNFNLLRSSFSSLIFRRKNILCYATFWSEAHWGSAGPFYFNITLIGILLCVVPRWDVLLFVKGMMHFSSKNARLLKPRGRKLLLNIFLSAKLGFISLYKKLSNWVVLKRSKSRM